eukprot:7947371-Pyramimonas_sp.AAC.1
MSETIGSLVGVSSALARPAARPAVPAGGGRAEPADAARMALAVAGGPIGPGPSTPRARWRRVSCPAGGPPKGA